MAFLKLQFKPGINRDRSNYSGEGGWWECDKIRFHAGFPEKLGGWEKYTTNTYYGVCRQLFSWITTFSDTFTAVGTNSKLYIELAGRFNDVTPIRETLTTPDTDNPISTENGSNLVTVSLGIAHGAATGDFVTISGVEDGVNDNIGGVPLTEINANVQVTVTSATEFTFVAATTATSTAGPLGGTAVTMAFEIHAGGAVLTYGYGWGVGLWSYVVPPATRGWGQSATVPVLIPQQDWWFDNMDNDLFANIRGGVPYVWLRGAATDPTTALNTRAITLRQYATDEGWDPDAVPSMVTQIMVSQQDRHLIAFGAVPFGETDPATFDPLLIRWADQDTPADWTPTVTNSSGFLRVSRGSRIITAMPTRQETLVWTDVSLYALQFLGTTDVFGLQEYASDITIAGPRARISASNVVYWMGKDKFYTYTGRVETLPCSLLDHVFDDINTLQLEQVTTGTNEKWDEVWWFYPSAASTYNDRYVVYNYVTQLWFYGTMPRSAWLDSQLRPAPMACDGGITGSTGLLYNQETGVDADGVAIESYIQSNDFDLGDGDKLMLTRRLIPDLRFDGSTAATPSVTMTIRSRNFPGSPLRADTQDARTVAETTVDEFTEQVFIRTRARQLAFRIESEDLGVQWNLGTPRLDVREDGGR